MKASLTRIYKLPPGKSIDDVIVNVMGDPMPVAEAQSLIDGGWVTFKLNHKGKPVFKPTDWAVYRVATEYAAKAGIDPQRN